MGLPQGFYAGIILELVKGAFFNYVDKVLQIIDHLNVDICTPLLLWGKISV